MELIFIEVTWFSKQSSVSWIIVKDHCQYFQLSFVWSNNRMFFSVLINKGKSQKPQQFLTCTVPCAWLVWSILCGVSRIFDWHLFRLEAFSWYCIFRNLIKIGRAECCLLGAMIYFSVIALEHWSLYSVSGKGPKWRMKQVFRTFRHSPVTVPLFMLGWITAGIATYKKILERRWGETNVMQEYLNLMWYLATS